MNESKKHRREVTMKHSKNDVWSVFIGLDGRNGMEAKHLIHAIKKAEPKEVYELLERLAPMVIQEYQGCQLTVVVFSALTELLIEVGIDSKIIILNFLCAIKLVLLGVDKASLGEEIYFHYFDSLERLQSFCSQLLAPEQLKQLNPSERSEFAIIYMTIMLHSCEPMVFSMYHPFQQAFHVSCPHCGNDIHSLYVNVEEPDKCSHIIQAAIPKGTQGEILLPEDTYQWFYQYLSDAEEEYYIRLLPYLYGNHICGKCKQPYRVIDGMTEYIKKFYISIPIPTKKEIEKNQKHAKENQKKGNYEKALFYHMYALFLQEELSDKNYVDIAKIYLQISTDYTFMLQYQHQKLFAKKAVAILEGWKDVPLELAKAYRMVGVAYAKGCVEEEEKQKEFAKAEEYYNKAKEIFDRELGIGNDESMHVNYNLALMLAEQQQDAEGGIKLLKENIQLEEEKSSPDEDKIAEIHKTISDIYMEELEDYKNSIHHFQPYLDYICKEYGEDSDMAADSYHELAERYQELDEIDAAAKYYERALEININEMGKVYLLPSMFKKAATGMLKLLNINKDDQELMQRSMSTAESFDDIGFLYLEHKKYKKAMKAFYKALALRKWVFQHPTKEFGDSYANIAKVYEAQEKIKEMAEAYRKAISIYKEVIRYDYQDGRPIFILEAEECEETIDKIVENLESMGIIIEKELEEYFDYDYEENDYKEYEEYQEEDEPE